MASSVAFPPDSEASVVINYSLQLPGSHVGKRIIQLDLDLDPQTDFLESTQEDGQTFAARAGVSATGQVDTIRAQNFLKERLLGIGFSRDQVEKSVAMLPELLDTPGAGIMMRRVGTGPESTPPPDQDWIIEDPVRGNPLGLVREFAANAIRGVVMVPGSDGAGRGDTTPVPEVESPEPQLFLIERYTISSTLGNYGMGRTVRTFTLLPGESTTIKLKTWQSTKESIKESSSIIDSHEQSAKDRFSSKVQDETTDKKTRSKTESWNAEAEASASWGWGSAKVSGSAAGEYQSGREQFAKQTSESVSDHALEASSKRELSVTSSSEVTTETGSETLIERQINNVNMRRVMNFVFRELNQEYITRLHLTDIQVAYTNGLEGTWRQVPISGMRGLLSEVLTPGKIDEVAQAILKVAGVVFNAADEPVRVLEIVDYDPAADSISVRPMLPGPIEPPTETTFYRFRRGPLAQEDAEHPVAGVLLSEQQIVMRTDSVLVEALLGQSDALDSFAMEIQEAAAKEKTLRNDRELLLHETLRAIADPVERAQLAAALFNAPDED